MEQMDSITKHFGIKRYRSVAAVCAIYLDAQNVETHLYSKSWIIKLPGLASYLYISISLTTRESGIRRDKYLSAAIFKKAVHSDDP